MANGILSPAPLDSSARPHLFMVVDTEEEFDWSKPFARENVAVTAIAETPRLQEIVEPFGLKPTYVIDFPVASTVSSANLLGGFAASDRCEIGAHLHPWVNPPYTETLGPRNSYACNLGIDLERQKIASLKQAIAGGLGVDARAYKAGRYGFGPTTAQVLEALDFDVDLSVNPHMDFRSDGGPSFEGFEPVPSTFGVGRRLLELPCTTSFIGAARRFGAPLHRLASERWLEPVKAVGILSRSGLLNKVMLSPEGSTYQEMRALTDTLLGDGLRTFALTFHSPSLKPGCTRYVRSEGERDAFLQVIKRYCSYFFNEVGGVPTTPSALYRQIVGTPKNTAREIAS
jgi:hypothetical protein